MNYVGKVLGLKERARPDGGETNKDKRNKYTYFVREVFRWGGLIQFQKLWDNFLALFYMQKLPHGCPKQGGGGLTPTLSTVSWLIVGWLQRPRKVEKRKKKNIEMEEK